MYDKTLLAAVVAICGIAMFMNSGIFHNVYGRKLSYLTTTTSVGGSIFKRVSNSSISTGQSSSSAINNSIQASNNNNNKVVVLSFDDNRKGDFIYAKPILDKYGIKVYKRPSFKRCVISHMTVTNTAGIHCQHNNVSVISLNI